MTRDSNKAVEWVVKNRVRRDPTRRAGEVVVDVTRTIQACDLRRLLPVVEVLSEAVDDEFERHCRVVDVRNGCLLIHVDGPSLVSEMQRRWQSTLRETLRQSPQRLGARDVRFEYGRLGMSVGSAPRRRAVQEASRLQTDYDVEE